MKVAEVLAGSFQEAGVAYIFGHPGGDVLDLIAAARAVGIAFVLTRHETNAAHMADVYSQLTGRPGVCLSTLGPGATNLITGVAHCYLDRAPVIAITGQVASDVAHVFWHQNLDLDRLYRPITKWTATLTPGNAGRVIRHALKMCAAGRPGPVHLTLPGDVAAQDADPVPPAPALVQRQAHGSWSATLAPALDLLDRARKPVAMAGLGVIQERAHGALRSFCSARGIPVICTPKAKGVIPADSPLYLGVAGLGMTADRILFQALAGADLIVAVGYDQVELVQSWLQAWDSSKPVVWIDHVPNDDPWFGGQVEVIGPIAETLQALSPGHSGAHGTASGWSAAELVRWRRQVAETMPAAGRESPGGCSPAGLLTTLRQLLPREAVVTCDVGSHKILSSQLWPAYEPGTFFVSNGLSAMGYALPAAIAAKLVRPDVPVVGVMGDGGFGMSQGELETAVRLRLPVIVVVLNDGSLSLIRLKQEARHQLPTGVDFAGADHAAVARAYGARGYTVQSEADFAAAVRGALAARAPSLIDVRINPAEYRTQIMGE